MAIIDSLKDKIGQIIYPKTLTKAVYEETTNKRLDNTINEIEDEIGVLSTNVNNNTQVVGDVSADLVAHKADLAKYARFNINSNQSIPNNTNSQILWDTKTAFNGEDFCEIDVTTKQVKILKTGMYELFLAVSFAGNATGSRVLWIYNILTNYPTNSVVSYNVIKEFAYITEGTILNIRVSQTSGSALDITTSNTRLLIRKVV